MGLDAIATGSSYQFDFDHAGTTTTVLTLPSVTLTIGGVYTIYVVGPGDPRSRAWSTRISDARRAGAPGHGVHAAPAKHHCREKRPDRLALLRDVEHAVEVPAVALDDDDLRDASLRAVAFGRAARQLGREDHVRGAGTNRIRAFIFFTSSPRL